MKIGHPFIVMKMAQNKRCCTPDGRGLTPSPIEVAPHGRSAITTDFCGIASGTFCMGSNDIAYPQDGEGPVRDVYVSGFSIARTAVTNREFQAFCTYTGYQTVAQRAGASFVFQGFLKDPSAWRASNQAPWWRDVNGASWAAPYGQDSDIADILDHPVTHIALQDAHAFCHWSGTRLPTEAEWELAARGGLDQNRYPWGDTLEPDGHVRCNIWQGEFPGHSNGDIGTVPVMDYGPNEYGLFNMVGNVWEWTTDRFTTLHSSRSVRNPKGPLNGAKFVAKGGSYLCHASYCDRYRVAARQALDPITTAGNTGFRVVLNP